MRVLVIHGAEARHIDLGSPWQNGLSERFNGTLRDECLNMETVEGRDHARIIGKVFGRQYNNARPHSSLGYRTPREFANSWTRAESRDGDRGDRVQRDPGALPTDPRY